MSRIITLLTDFGIRDAYVASLKGVILGRFPRAEIVDISHEVTPQAIEEAAYLIQCCYRDFPKGTIHVVIVDPGVGTPRKAIAVRAARHVFVGPDNGVFSPVYDADPAHRVREICHVRARRARLSMTFHGRDLFAPAAAYLAAGGAHRSLGPPVPNPVRRRPIRPLKGRGSLAGRIIHVDHFGNLITNIREDDLGSGGAARTVVKAPSIVISGLAETYGNASSGRLLALINSAGYLEIAVNGGSAQALTGLDIGSTVTVSTL